MHIRFLHYVIMVAIVCVVIKLSNNWVPLQNALS